MHVSVRQSSGVTILDLNGTFTIESGLALRDALRQALDGGAKKILLNLRGMSYMDTAGMGELINSYTTTSKRGVRLKLADASAKIMDLLRLSRLLTVIDTYDSEAAALAAFES